MADKLETIDYILTHGIDLKNRRIYFGGIGESGEEATGSGIEWKSVEEVIRKIHYFEQEAPNKPIELYMSSPGGDPYATQRLCDVIEHSPCQVKFFGSGEICSAAVWILAVCDERYLSPRTRLLIHDSPSVGSTEGPVKLTDSRISLEEDLTLQGLLNKMFADNSRMPVEFWEQVVKRDMWITADEAVMFGLADKILEPKKRGNLRKMRIHALKKEVDKKEMRSLLGKISRRIHDGRNVKIELHVPKEHFDSKVVVKEDDPVTEKKTFTVTFADPLVTDGASTPPGTNIQMLGETKDSTNS